MSAGARGIALAGGLLLLCGLSAPSEVRAHGRGGPGAGEETGPASREVRRIFREVWLEAGEREGLVVERLGALGPASIPTLLAVHRGDDELLAAFHGRALGERSPGRMAELALDVLARLPVDSVLPHLTVSSGAPVEELFATLEVLGHLGSGKGLAPYLSILTVLEDRGPLRGQSRDALRRSLASLLRADGSALWVLDRNLEGRSRQSVELVIDAIEEAAHPDTVRILPELLGRGEDLDQRILVLLGRCEERYPWRSVADPRLVVRPFLKRKKGSTSRESAVVALGLMDDLDSADGFAWLLEDPDPALARSADWALRRLSGMDTEMGKKDWQQWFASERGWWESLGKELAVELETGGPTRKAAVARELLQHRAFRHEVAVLLAEALAADPEFAVTAGRILERLQSRRPVPVLVEALYASDKRIRHAAWEALQALTGEHLPLDGRSWEAWLRG